MSMKPNVGRYIPLYPTASQPLPRRHRVFIERDYSQGLGLRFSNVFPPELERKMNREDFDFIIHAFNDLYARAEKITWTTILENVASVLTCHTMLLCWDTQFRRTMRQVAVFVEEQNEQMIRAGSYITLHDPAERYFRMDEKKQEDAPAAKLGSPSAPRGVRSRYDKLDRPPGKYHLSSSDGFPADPVVVIVNDASLTMSETVGIYELENSPKGTHISGPDGSSSGELAKENAPGNKSSVCNDEAFVPVLVSSQSGGTDSSATFPIPKCHTVSGGQPNRRNRFTVSKVAEDVLTSRRQSADRSSVTVPVNTANKSGTASENAPTLVNGNSTKISGGNAALEGLPFEKLAPFEDKEGKVSHIAEKASESAAVHEPFVFLGVCAMAKKARSKYMTEILSRITQEFEQIKMVIFPENVIMNEPVDKWPHCDALISFYSGHFPLEKAVQYAKLRQPFLVNDLEMQYIIQNRQKVYEILERAGVEVPRYAVLDRDCADPNKARLEEFDDHIIVNGAQFNKPFVEKPVSAEDHNIYIYYPTSAGSGSQRLFRKIGTRSSVYSNESRVRQTGSYIYEEFMPTDGTDVKVYTVGPEYAHAEARKSPALDGVVERDKEGKELRFPIILNNVEKLIARRVCIAFKQAVCGFDLLRANGRSYVCDVNGFSFVKNSMIYYNDFAKIVANMVLRKLAPELHIRWSMPYQLEDPPIVPTTMGQLMELRCVVAVVRHGDRTPKQKLKMELHHPKFISMFLRFGGTFDDNGREIKLKRPSQLQEVLDVVRDLLMNHRNEAIVKERRAKLVQLKSVLEMYGHFSGINRKVQIKYLPLDSPDLPESAVISDAANPITSGCLLLIMKWGGELTPLGKYQSEQLGQMFRCMYPGSGEASMKRGHGLLRLHSTFRHDLKIYASDEGRVQTTAAAFAKGLLALEGELTPILVQMVKSANTNGLLDSDLDARDHEKAVKKTLRSIMKRDKTFSEEDTAALNPTNSPAIKTAMDAVKNPVKCCEEVHKYIAELNSAIKEKVASANTELPMLYAGESWELLQRRWGKLEKDFRLQDGSFDITKIPDIYDCIRFDMHHNQWISRLGFASKLFALARHLSDIVVPLEYGITANEKLAIAQGICTPLLEKIRADLRQMMSQTEDLTSKSNENSNQLHPRYTDPSSGRLVRSRLYFTSESHIHSLVNILRFGGLFEENDKQWNRALEYLSRVPELNFLTQIVIMLYEDSNKALDSDERFHVEVHFSSGMLRRSDYKDMHGGKNRRNSIQNEDLDAVISDSHKDLQPKSTSSKTILPASSDDKGETGSSTGYFKAKKDRLMAKVRELGIIKNRIFSTAVIKGLDQSTPAYTVPAEDEDDSNTFHVPNVKSLETLHNALSFKQLDNFMLKILQTSYRYPSITSDYLRNYSIELPEAIVLKNVPHSAEIPDSSFPNYPVFQFQNRIAAQHSQTAVVTANTDAVY